VGCEGYITPGSISHFCLFREIGYELDGTFFTPCENQYHPECIKVGKPFNTSLVRATLGLQYPPAMTHFPFICEACTFRAVLGQELTWTPGDIQLVMLERMRLVDMAHAWASSSTLQGTSRYLGRLSNFGQRYGIDLFPKAPITHPPWLVVIPLLWGVLECTLQTSRNTGEGIKYNTVRSLQSAAFVYHLWEKMLQFPGHMYRDRENNVIGASHLSPTDSAIATLGNTGTTRRMGTESRPPVALRYSHVAFNQEFRGRQYDGCGNDWLSKYKYAAANFAEICAWGGWLRATENFSLDDEDVEIITPANRALHNLPIGVGAVLLTLGPETKVQSSKRVDVPLANTFASGISPHYWYLKLMECKENLGWIGGALFRHSNGQRWTSSYFKSTHVCPLLHIQRNRGDPSLAPYDGAHGNSIEAKFYSCGMYRRGGRSQVTKRRAGCAQAASKADIAEDGRWRTQNRGYEAMSEYNNESTLEDRVYITLLCMKSMDLQIFQWGFFFGFFYMPLLCEGFTEFKRGGVLLLFQRGGLKNDFARRGALLLNPPPSLLFPPPPRVAK
jgi:hypothetical protein